MLKREDKVGDATKQKKSIPQVVCHREKDRIVLSQLESLSVTEVLADAQSQRYSQEANQMKAWQGAWTCPQPQHVAVQCLYLI